MKVCTTEVVPWSRIPSLFGPLPDDFQVQRERGRRPLRGLEIDLGWVEEPVFIEKESVTRLLGLKKAGNSIRITLGSRGDFLKMSMEHHGIQND